MTTANNSLGTMPEWVAEQPFRWVLKGDELRRAASLLWAAIDEDMTAPSLGNSPSFWMVQSQWLMLEAFALENILKASLAAYGHKPWTADGKLTKTFKSHQLVELADRAGVDLSAEEREVCSLATQASTVFGRYPFGVTVSAVGGYVLWVRTIKQVLDDLYTRARAVALTGYTEIVG